MCCHKLVNPLEKPYPGATSGCLFCYMFREVRQKAKSKVHANWNPDKPQQTKRLDAPRHMKGRQLVFLCSWSDFFIPEADGAWRDAAWKVIRETPWHNYRVCTKRPERIRPKGANGPSLLPPDWDSEWNRAYAHVWLGVTVEHQKWTHRMDYIRNIPCTLRWVSAEPLLSALDLNLSGFSFVVCGGESGGKDENGNPEQIRKADWDWFRSLRDQCANAGVAFCHKQHGGLKKCSKAMHKQLFGNQPLPEHLSAFGCRVLDGQVYDAFPPFPPTVFRSHKVRRMREQTLLAPINPVKGLEYETSPDAYGYCDHCKTYFDYWRSKENGFTCPYGCKNKLRQLTPQELTKALADCEEKGCFQERFSYPTPLKPIPRQFTAPPH